MATVSVVNRPEGTYRIKDSDPDSSQYEVVLTARGPNAYKLGQTALAVGPRAISGTVLVEKALNGNDHTITFSLQKQEILYEWSMEKHRWLLANNSSTFGANPATINPIVRGLLDPAPKAWSRRTGPLINYVTDSLFFECDLCGNNHDEYERAMEAAAIIIRTNQSDPNTPNIRNLSLSWCTGDYEVASVLTLVASIPHLNEVTLIMHRHFDEYRADGECLNHPATDDREAQCIILSGDLDKWSFKVSLLDYRGWGITLDPDECYDKSSDGMDESGDEGQD